jgi:hypothetical protein
MAVLSGRSMAVLSDLLSKDTGWDMTHALCNYS